MAKSEQLKITFNNKEQHLFDFANKKTNKSQYIKELIKKDMSDSLATLPENLNFSEDVMSKLLLEILSNTDYIKSHIVNNLLEENLIIEIEKKNLDGQNLIKSYSSDLKISKNYSVDDLD